MLVCPCVPSPLNGNSANTEGGRLHLAMKSCPPPISQRLGNPEFCCPPATPRVQQPITPSEGSRIVNILTTCGSAPSGQVTQARAIALLQQYEQSKNYKTESMRIQEKIQETVFCATDPFSETARFSEYSRLAAAEVCPPLPPPPAPPARACPLEKNRKF